MVIKIGAEEVLALFPNLPQWVKVILQDLEGAKALASQIESLPMREAAIYAARAKAAQAIKDGR